MANENILDKKLVYINSINVPADNFIGGTNFDFFYNLEDAVRGAVYIKLLKAEVSLNPGVNINGVAVADGDPIYVSLKKYNRMSVSILGKLLKCFEVITLNIYEKYGTGSLPGKEVPFKTEYTGIGCNPLDTNTFILDPIEPNLKRIDVQLYDKNYNLIPKSLIKYFTLTLCIYSTRKKITMA